MEEHLIIKKPKKDLKYRKLPSNVKIVVIPGIGKVYVCPYPDSHFSELKAVRDNTLFSKKQK